MIHKLLRITNISSIQDEYKVTKKQVEYYKSVYPGDYTDEEIRKDLINIVYYEEEYEREFTT